MGINGWIHTKSDVGLGITIYDPGIPLTKQKYFDPVNWPPIPEFLGLEKNIDFSVFLFIIYFNNKIFFYNFIII